MSQEIKIYIETMNDHRITFGQIKCCKCGNFEIIDNPNGSSGWDKKNFHQHSTSNDLYPIRTICLKCNNETNQLNFQSSRFD